MLLYKYTTFETAVRILMSGKIRFSSASLFNDPFEFSFDAEDSNDKIIFKEHLINRCGVFCISKNKNNILMLSHYANQHKGLVIEFDLDGDVAAAANQNMDILDLENGDENIGYKKTLPNISASLNAMRTHTKWPTEDFNECVYSVVGRKHEDWSYEKEVRFLISWDENKKYEDLSFQQCGMTIKNIYFGCRASKEDKDILSEIVGFKYKEVGIFDAIKSFPIE